MAIVNFPILYFPDPTKGKPLWNGQIYIGQPDLDPEIVFNQKNVRFVQEDGTLVGTTQPIILSSGGVPTYNGSPVRLDVDGNYSIKVLDRFGSQAYYVENVFEGEPIIIGDLEQYISAEFETVRDMVFGDALNYPNAIDFSEYEGRRVSTTYNNSTSKTGGSYYVIKTVTQAASDGDVIDGTGSPSYLGGNHLLNGGTHVAILEIESGIARAECFGTSGSDIGAAWNLAHDYANTNGYKLLLPAGDFTSSETLFLDGIFQGIFGAGSDQTRVTFTNDVLGMRFRGGRLDGIQLIGVGKATATADGLLIEQNQEHILNDVRTTGFYNGIEFRDGNFSYLNNIYSDSNANHGVYVSDATPNGNDVTVGVMSLKLNGGDGIHWDDATDPFVCQQWNGGTIGTAFNDGKGFNISGRGHNLTIYDEDNGITSTLGPLCEATEIKLVFGTAIDNGSNNNIKSYRQGATEAISNSRLESTLAVIRDRSFIGQFHSTHDRNNVMLIEEAGSSSPSLIEIKSASGPACGLSVSGRINSQVISNTVLSALLSVANGNVVEVTNSAATTITSITSTAGQIFTLVFLDSNTTIQNGVNLQLAGGDDFSPTINSTITFVSRGTVVYEVARSIN